MSSASSFHSTWTRTGEGESESWQQHQDEGAYPFDRWSEGRVAGPVQSLRCRGERSKRFAYSIFNRQSSFGEVKGFCPVQISHMTFRAGSQGKTSIHARLPEHSSKCQLSHHNSLSTSLCCKPGDRDIRS
eukprot:767880-Hanusia_phi.AAC.6